MLLFEEVFEGLAGIVGTRRGRGSGARGGGLRIGGGGGVFFNGHTKFVKGAGILRVLGRDAFGDGLGALESRAGIEEAALFAAVQLELALGTFSIGIETGRENGAAIGASCAGDRADHTRSARTELIGAAGFFSCDLSRFSAFSESR
ncbi:MAG: hypothetical protein AUH86_10200 [Acidobacteria bacterium 13_1_40CM_4_58_4]|nr:MAG: hypothetical protein AUH86_10200 [Acidobacteria bacterium 13_1_40CM_4_58_4]